MNKIELVYKLYNYKKELDSYIQLSDLAYLSTVPIGEETNRKNMEKFRFVSARKRIFKKYFCGMLPEDIRSLVRPECRSKGPPYEIE